MQPYDLALDSLKGFWKEIFSLDEVDDDANFFTLGGDSVTATILMAHIEEKFGFEFDPVEVFDTPVLKELALKLSSVLSADPPLIEERVI